MMIHFYRNINLNIIAVLLYFCCVSLSSSSSSSKMGESDYDWRFTTMQDEQRNVDDNDYGDTDIINVDNKNDNGDDAGDDDDDDDDSIMVYLNHTNRTSVNIHNISSIDGTAANAGFVRKPIRNLTRRLSNFRTVNNKEFYKYFQKAIWFRYYKNGELVYESTGNELKTLKNTKCTPKDKFAFILHGWRQSCDTEWVLQLIERLSYHRGGCIVCVDYSILAKSSYMWLYRNFNPISNTISEKILTLVDEGFNPKDGYMFGFSFGGQLATSIGRTLGLKNRFNIIDTCDMAGPGFDILTEVDHRSAADHVQCWHSSVDKGTRVYACHQNIRLGNCGYRQPAVDSQPYYSSHGLCVQMYINAFDYPFYAMQTKPKWCVSRDPAENIPPRYTVGYNENRDLNIVGDIFVPTSVNFPYNLSEKQLLRLETFGGRRLLRRGYI